jgi:hypothetical protein
MRKTESSARKTISASAATIIAAVCGLIGASLGVVLQGRGETQLEAEKRKTQLVLKAMEAENQEKALANLLFFVEAGLIPDPDGKLAAATRKVGRITVIPNDFIEAQPLMLANDLGLSLSTDKRVYYGNELITVSVSADRDCFFRLFHIGRDGSTLLAFPLSSSDKNHLQSGEVRALSVLQAAPPFGFDLLVGVASPTQFEDMGFGLEGKDGVSLRDLARQGVAQSEWGNVEVAISVISVAPTEEKGGS